MTEPELSNNVETAQVEAKKPRKCRFWHLFLIILLVLAGIFGFLATGKGQRWTLAQLDRWVESLSISEIDGSLQHGLRLKNTRVQHADLALSLDQAFLKVDFSCLWRLQLCSRIETENLALSVGGTELALDKFQSTIQASRTVVKLSETALSGLQLSLPSPQAVENPQKMTKEDWARVQAFFEKPLFNRTTLKTLPLELTVEELRANDLHISQKTDSAENPLSHLVHIESVQLSTQATSDNFALTDLQVKSDRGTLVSKGAISLKQNAPLHLRLEAKLNEWKEIGLPASEAVLAVSGELFNNTVLNLQTNGALNAELSGQVFLAEPKLPFSLQLTAENAAYPFMNVPKSDQLQLKKSAISLVGNVLDYALNAQTEVSGLGIPKTALELKGKGGLTAFEVEQLKLNMLQGSSTLSGRMAWLDGFEWNSEMELDKLYTKELFNDWQAFVSGKLHSEGYVGRGTSGQDWAISFKELKLAGVLSGRPLVMLGNVSLAPNLISTPSTKLMYGINMIEMAGQLSQTSDFSANINAPELTGFLPKLHGNVKGDVKVSGKWTEPQIKMDLNAEHFSYHDLSLNGLRVKADVQTEKQLVGELEADLRQFKLEPFEAGQAKLRLKGNEQQHHLQFSAKGDPIGLNVNANGSFDRARGLWTGQLSDLLLASPIGDWRSDKAVDVRFDGKAVKSHIASHCWLNNQAKLCFPKAFEAGKEGAVPFEIKQFNLSSLAQFLPENQQLEGAVNSVGEIQWFEKQPPKAKMTLDSNQIRFTQKMDYRQFPLVFTPVKFELNLADDNLQLKSDIGVENNGSVKGEMQLKALSSKRELGGHIQVEDLNIHLFQPLFERGESIDGELNGRLNLAGSVLSPQLLGELNLTRLSLSMLSVPFDITDGQLKMIFHGSHSVLSGEIESGKNRLQLDGKANWQNPEAWYTSVRAQGERFRIELPGIAKLDISPNVELNATAQKLTINGEVDVPWARVEIEELPDSAVSVSADEVIMDGSAKKKARLPIPQKLAKNPQGMQFSSDIAVNIGDDVRLDAYGLKTQLKGLVKVRQGEKGLGLYGQVKLHNGTFASYGQDLVLRKGVISFTGSPQQPTLDVEAIRNPEAMEDSTITAGVRVSGMVDAPNVQVFSVPSMAQDQALSYLLTGRALDSAGDGSSSNSVAAALIGLSLSKSSKLVGTVGSTFGISDLNVTTAGIGDNTKVVVSGSLSPRLRVQYGVGLFAPLTELTLRYRLAPSLYLQMISNVNQAVDLLYRFEF